MKFFKDPAKFILPWPIAMIFIIVGTVLTIIHNNSIELESNKSGISYENASCRLSSIEEGRNFLFAKFSCRYNDTVVELTTDSRRLIATAWRNRDNGLRCSISGSVINSCQEASNTQ